MQSPTHAFFMNIHWSSFERLHPIVAITGLTLFARAMFSKEANSIACLKKTQKVNLASRSIRVGQITMTVTQSVH